jgi:hypothetical protein
MSIDKKWINISGLNIRVITESLKYKKTKSQTEIEFVYKTTQYISHY